MQMAVDTGRFRRRDFALSGGAAAPSASNSLKRSDQGTININRWTKKAGAGVDLSEDVTSALNAAVCSRRSRQTDYSYVVPSSRRVSACCQIGAEISKERCNMNTCVIETCVLRARFTLSNCTSPPTHSHHTITPVLIGSATSSRRKLDTLLSDDLCSSCSSLPLNGLNVA